MPLNPALIYRRTDRGLREVYEKSHQFTQSERLVLILLDGRLSVGGLHARLPSLDGDRIERTLAKLEEAGLVEPLDVSEAELQSPSRAEEVMLLEPEVVAEFLEQAALDPLTTPGFRSGGAASGAASSGPEASALATSSAATLSKGAAKRESGHSHFLPSEAHDWEPTEATAFAITTVNVPDRLDMQEERDRVEMEAYEAQRRRAEIRRWMKGLLVVAVVVVIGAVAYAVVKPMLDAASAPRVAERLSGAFQRPVKVAATEFRLSPSPRLVLRGIDVGGEFGASEAALLINWMDLWRALNGGQWAWGEARIAPLAMTPDQAVAALRLIPNAAGQFPRSIASVRVESVQVQGSRLFPGTYEAALRRGSDGVLGPLSVRSVNGEGAVQIDFRPTASQPAGIDFALQARGWSIPLVMKARWDEARANGTLRGNLLEVSNFTLHGFFGITTGSMTLTRDVEWVATGTAEAANIDVETVLTSIGRPRAASSSAEAGAAPMQGTANLRLVMAGRGATLEDLAARSAIAGSFTVRSAVLNGINLGMVATQGAAVAGSTRFTEFGGTVAASGNTVRFEDTAGRAGAMIARANFTVAEDATIAGTLRVELGGQRVQAPVNLRIAGTVSAPRFTR